MIHMRDPSTERRSWTLAVVCIGTYMLMLDLSVIAKTLEEVAACRKSGIMINTFMLARDRALVEFVKRMSEISKGKAYFTTTMTLGQFILMDFLKRKTKKVS